MRLCRGLDRNPALMACLLGRPPQRFHPGLSKLVRVPPGRWPLVDDAIYEASGRSTEYCHAAGGIAQAARHHRQRLLALGLDYRSQAAELAKRLEGARLLAEKVGVPGPGCHDDAQAYSMHALERLPADSSELLAVGDLLLTHTVSCLFQPALDRAVILIDEADPGSTHMRGIAMNKPDGATVGQALASWPAEERSRAVAQGLEPLLEVQLYTGGDLVERAGGFLERVRWLHGLGGRIPGAREVLPGVWIGGDMAEAAKLVTAGDADLQQIRPCVGFAGWSRQQMALELQRGVWVRARARPRTGQPGDFCFWSCAAEAASMWQDLMLAAGMPALAHFPRGDAVDSQIRGWMEAHWQAQVQEIMALHAETAARARTSSDGKQR